MRKKRGIAIAAVVAVALAGVMVAVVATPGCRRRPRATPDASHVPLAAGGAGVEETDAAGDAGSADLLVEDAVRHRVRGFPFALDQYELRIEDVGMTTALDSVLSRTNAELAVNGGFFDPAGKPLGLTISDGAVVSRLSTTMSGGIVTFDGDRARLFASEGFATPENTRFAIQCKPRLVVDGIPNIKSDDGQRSERTALCLRDGGKTIEVIIVREESGAATGPSLFALGKFLARRGCEGALNLDGGPSTGVAFREEGQPRIFAPRRPVRHAITFKRRGT
jgi:hypothetical protein